MWKRQSNENIIDMRENKMENLIWIEFVILVIAIILLFKLEHENDKENVKEEMNIFRQMTDILRLFLVVVIALLLIVLTYNIITVLPEKLLNL